MLTIFDFVYDYMVAHKTIRQIEANLFVKIKEIYSLKCLKSICQGLQIAPNLWDAVRISVDRRNEEGLYILTGSNSIDQTKIMHTGTGRIDTLQMYPMSLFETGESNGTVSLKELFRAVSAGMKQPFFAGQN